MNERRRSVLAFLVAAGSRVDPRDPLRNARREPGTTYWSVPPALETSREARQRKTTAAARQKKKAARKARKKNRGW
jgi:hypothetical protein